MPASKAEQVLEALSALLETVSGVPVDRNSVLPKKVPGGGLIILRDGDPSEPEQALGGFGNAYYAHAVEIEVYVEEDDAAAVTLPSTPSSSRPGRRSNSTRPSTASPSA